jgi:hypothetical protein
MTARRFHMPGDEAADNAPFWYSFEYGSVHFTVLSSEHALEPGSKQHRWLADDLANVDRWAPYELNVQHHDGSCQRGTIAGFLMSLAVSVPGLALGLAPAITEALRRGKMC